MVPVEELNPHAFESPLSRLRLSFRHTGTGSVIAAQTAESQEISAIGSRKFQ
jgi:hypothetical protein